VSGDEAVTRDRYAQCDDTCTVDCGACKGRGRPAPVSGQAEVSDELETRAADLADRIEGMGAAMTHRTLVAALAAERRRAAEREQALVAAVEDLLDPERGMAVDRLGRDRLFAERDLRALLAAHTAGGAS
jgi:acyl transferase domain-containing protein